MTHFAPYQAQLGTQRSAPRIAALNSKFCALAEHTERRFYISFNLRSRQLPDGTWETQRKAHWPILFHTRGEAERAMEVLPIFQNTHLAGIKSASIETTRVKRQNIAP